MREKLTNRLFARRAVNLAGQINGWASDALGEEPCQEVPDADLARFIGEVHAALDRMWLHDVRWSPAQAEDGKAGSSFLAPRISKLHPGMDAGRCTACDAHMVAAKRTLYCDHCEERRRAAVAERRSALTAQSGREGRDG